MFAPRKFIGTHDGLFITLDTLRYDVAESLAAAGRIPHLAAHLAHQRWERRHTPGSFTYAAHAAFFAGFLPTPAEHGRHTRPFALRFPGSETTAENTAVFDAPDLISGFRSVGYRTICIGGVGFFNKQTPLGSVFPNLFDESYWSVELGVTDPRSTEHQVDLALKLVAALPAEQRLFLFLNVSAIHQPNRCYLPGSTEDNLDSHAAALEYVDRQLGRLFTGLRTERSWFAVVCSDHGTAYGEGGHTGHRFAHPVVWDVPYGEFVLNKEVE
jgi:hypothetical protein